jgi:hypothetical protein
VGVTGRPNPPSALVDSRYELVREVHVDGETIDWEGFDTKLDRTVIVRLLRPELAADPDARDRFMRAARGNADGSRALGDHVLDGGTDAQSGLPFVVRALPVAASPTPDGLPASASASATVDAHPVGGRFARRGRWLALSAVVTIVLVLIALRPGVEGWLAWVNTPAAHVEGNFALPPVTAANKDPEPTAVAPRATAAAIVPSATPTRAPTPTVVQTGQSRRIVNTDGQGVALRATPGGDRFPGKGYDEGAIVQAFEQSGEWTRIRGADGREGWVLSVTLAP